MHRQATILFLIIAYPLFSAPSVPYNPKLSLGISHRSAENPYYWKNHPPFPGYWQQDVHYRIQARLDADNLKLTGNEWLKYYNNSPDTLREVYFRLNENAYKPGSYLDKQQRANGDYQLSRLSEEERGGTDVEKIADGDGQPLASRLDDTILHVMLNRPLRPGDSTIFQIDFVTHIGTFERRLKYNPSHGFDQFNITQWYPKISVYDRKMGWTTDQHLGREFYGDFGTFEVEITLPHEFIVAATGWCTNEAEVMPDSLKQKLRLENFKDKPFHEKPSILVTPEEGKTKTWKFWATNVHDFAWTADPTYRIGEAEWNGIKIFAYAREWKAAKWQDAAQFTAEVIRVYSTDIGPYGYWKMIVADADDGMEYPMLTLDGGTSPSYYGLLAHEVGHNWFFAMVGNNETYRAFLDEGFANFITSWSIEKLVGRPEAAGAGSFKYHNDNQERRANFFAYTNSVRNGYDAPLNMHSDNYDVAGGTEMSYGLVYFKAAVMLYNLQYMLGDDLFRRAFAAYFEQWKFCHPYPEDFRDSIQRYTHWDLSLFFDQWLDSTWDLDYAIDNVKSRKTPAGYESTVTLRRKGKMVMPIDLTFFMKDGSQKKAIIPVSEQVKNEPGAAVLPKWYSMSGKINRTYEATLTLPQPVARVEIDPSGRLADVYRLDNRSGFLPKQKWVWALSRPDTPLDAYLVRWRPDLWYNNVDGLLLGADFRGAYLDRFSNGDRQIQFSPRFAGNTPKRTFSYSFNYRQPLRSLGAGQSWQAQSSISTGLSRHALTFSQRWQRSPFETSFRQLDLQWRFEKFFDSSYLMLPGSYSGAVNSLLKVRYLRNYHAGFGKGTYQVEIINSMPGGPSRFSKISLTSLQDVTINRHFSLRLRVFAGYLAGNAPAQSRLYLHGGSPEDWISNTWYAALGTLPARWAREGHIQPAGGGNVRGYQIDRAYRSASQPAGVENLVSSGNRLLTANLELNIPSLITPLFEMVPGLSEYFTTKTYLFFDSGIIDFATRDDVIGLRQTARSDAGIGVIAELQLPGSLRELGALKVRFDFPLYLSKPLAGDDDFEFRWLMGIGRAF